MKRLCIFCGSKTGKDPLYRQSAVRMGRLLLQKGIGLVYGGGNIGLMGVLADAVLEGGGEVIGVIPEALVPYEVAHAGLTKLHVVRSMHERKQKMFELSDGFVALPGGVGTWDEFCEILTWAQLGLHKKPCGLVNVKGYYDPFLQLLQRAWQEGFLRKEHHEMVLIDDSPEGLLDRMTRFKPPEIHKLIDKNEV